MQQQKPDIPLFELYDLWYTPFWKQTWFIVVMVCGAFICVLGIGWFLYYYLQRRRQVKKTYWQQAIQSIDDLSPHEFMRNMRSDLFYVKITSVLKMYLQRRYNMSLIGKTDQELLHALSVSDQLQNERTCLEDIISGAVFIKFAHQQSALDKMQQDKDLVLNFIKKTMPESS